MPRETALRAILDRVKRGEDIGAEEFWFILDHGDASLDDVKRAVVTKVLRTLRSDLGHEVRIAKMQVNILMAPRRSPGAGEVARVVYSLADTRLTILVLLARRRIPKTTLGG